MIEFIEASTVGMLGTQEVPMANATRHYTYLLPDGAEEAGPACMLLLPEATWVGVGSEVNAGGFRWRVTEVRVPDDDTGSVFLKRI